MRPEEADRRERQRLAAMARGAADLSGRREPPPEMSRRMRREGEARLGMRCAGCGSRITVGFQFTRIDSVIGEDGKPTLDVAKLSACDGVDGCDFAARARADADVVEVIEFAWLSDVEGKPMPTIAAGE